MQNTLNKILAYMCEETQPEPQNENVLGNLEGAYARKAWWVAKLKTQWKEVGLWPCHVQLEHPSCEEKGGQSGRKSHSSLLKTVTIKDTLMCMSYFMVSPCFQLRCFL